MIDVDVAHVPSPQEIEQYKTPNGGWTKSTLAMWGVEFPPVSGWKEALEKAYSEGFTVGMVLECIGCRRGKFFVDYDPHPVCKECQEWEQEKYKREHNDENTIRQHKTNVPQACVQEQRVPTFKERVLGAFNPKSNRASGVRGFVYLIRAENGLYKIGKAKDVSKRMKPFSVHFPMPWELVYSFMSADYSNAEKMLHYKYADKRDIGEWFRLEPADVEYIKSIQDWQL